MTANTTEVLTPFPHTAQNRCFGCGSANPIGLHLEFFLDRDHRVVCLTSLADTFEGPRGYAHGGIIATILDETMSKAVRARGFTAMTRHMEVDYQRPVPIGAPLRLEGRVTHNEGRKHWSEASILDEKGSLLAHSKALFIEINPRPEPHKERTHPHG
jgi:uncharacterized protein (TIGR00369 family)